jgi:hypothetical protein
MHLETIIKQLNSPHVIVDGALACKVNGHYIRNFFVRRVTSASPAGSHEHFY